MNMAIRKGTIPRNIVYIGTSLAMPLTTNTFIPMGGVIEAISIITTNSTPNHMRSRFRLVRTGTKIGRVSTANN